MSPFESLLEIIIQDKALHLKWLNTLSYLENCGARKIAACEHPLKVKEEMLKHASEEFRHAHFLKNLQKKIGIPYEDYSISSLIGGFKAYHYLLKLDNHVSKILKKDGLSLTTLKEYAYLLTTYAIEIRAEDLYPLYHQLLKRYGFAFSVKSIMLEEQEHLAEIRAEMKCVPKVYTYIDSVLDIEKELWDQWHDAIQTSITTTAKV